MNKVIDYVKVLLLDARKQLSDTLGEVVKNMDANLSLCSRIWYKTGRRQMRTVTEWNVSDFLWTVQQCERFCLINYSGKTNRSTNITVYFLFPFSVTWPADVPSGVMVDGAGQTQPLTQKKRNRSPTVGICTVFKLMEMFSTELADEDPH